MKQAGKKQIEIAQAIGFSQSVISKELSRNHGEKPYQTRMLLQVHDELVFDLAREEEDELIPKILDIMRHALRLDGVDANPCALLLPAQGCNSLHSQCYCKQLLHGALQGILIDP